MANTSNTKNILLLGRVNQGKTTLCKAIKTVLRERYGLGEDTHETDFNRSQFYDDGLVFTYTIDGCCYRIIDIPSDDLMYEYLRRFVYEIDTVILVCTLSSFPGVDERMLLNLCKKFNVKIACAYVSCIDEHADIFFVDCTDDDIYEFVGNQGHPKTIKLTEEINSDFAATGDLTSTKNCYILHGDSKRAIKEPFSEYGDVIVRLIHSIKVALWGSE